MRVKAEIHTHSEDVVCKLQPTPHGRLAESRGIAVHAQQGSQQHGRNFMLAGMALDHRKTGPQGGC
eukprot:391188-Pelagomonas_calceolata.AAC.3